MKRLLAILLCISQSSWGVPAFVQGTSKDAGTTTTSTLAFGSNVAAHSTLVVALRTGTTPGTITVSDTLGTYVLVSSATQTGLGTFGIYDLKDSGNGGSDTVTVTLGNSVTLRWVQTELSGLNNSVPVDLWNEANAATGTSANSGNITTTKNIEYIYAAGATGNNIANTWTKGSAFTLLRTNLNCGSSTCIQTEEVVENQTTTISSGFTLSNSDDWISIIVGFVGNSGGSCTDLLGVMCQ